MTVNFAGNTGVQYTAAQLPGFIGVEQQILRIFGFCARNLHRKADGNETRLYRRHEALFASESLATIELPDHHEERSR